ncbi:hypothetical protein R3X25_06675 [Lutibacter sp. TH_r2]|nr:hypothetical protein [Lutibacter sp. TH_r2]MDV7186961.1 hypothetical protein [Lutibacter sp. TH_r2]
MKYVEMEAIIEKPQINISKMKINSIIPGFSYINHLGIEVKNIQTATL